MIDEAEARCDEPPIVFLSSVYRDGDGGTGPDLPLRVAIKEAAAGLPVRLRAPELPARTPGDPGPGADAIIDECFSSIKACHLFVFLHSRRHGSGVRFAPDDPTTSTYLEMELFAAALLGKPILVLQERGVRSEQGLVDLLDVLRSSLGEGDYVEDDLPALVERFEDEMRRRTGLSAASDRMIGLAIPDALSRLRSLGTPERDLERPSLLFLGGWKEGVRSGGDLASARRLLDAVVAGEARVEAPMSHGASLFRIWAAMRELLPLDRRDPDVGSAWDGTLSLWAKKASWFGVHGHALMGPLAAVNSQIDLRGSAVFVRSEDGPRGPTIARASALYSAAGVMKTRSLQLRHYLQTEIEATRAIAHDPDGRAGALSVRGHVAMRLAALGRPWRLFDAHADLRTSLRLRSSTGASAASVGEAETDYGYILLRLGRRQAGIALMMRGVEALRDDRSADGLAFLARGLRKLEDGARRLRRQDLEVEARDERIRLASAIEALDQGRPG